MTELIIFRAIQGLGAGGFMPLAQIIIGDIVPPAERGKRQGMVPIVFAVTSVLGPVLGGVITDALSWHWIFYVNLPVGAVAFYIIAKAMRKPVKAHAHKIDYLGSVLLTGAITAALLVLALGGTEWPWDGLAVKLSARPGPADGGLAAAACAPGRRAGAAARSVSEPHFQYRQPGDGDDLHGPDGRQRVLSAVFPAGDGHQSGRIGRDDGGDDGGAGACRRC